MVACGVTTYSFCLCLLICLLLGLVVYWFCWLVNLHLFVFRVGAGDCGFVVVR